MALVTHPLLTSNVDANLVKRDVFDKVIELYPDKAKFLTIVNKLGKRRPVHNYKFEMMEQDIEIFKTTVAADTLGGETSITVAAGDGQYFTTNDTIIVKSGSTYTQYIVTGVSGDVVSISPTAGAHTTGDLVIKGAKAVAENGSVSPSYSIEPSLLFNYIQLFDESFEVSLIEEKTWNYYTADQKKTALAYYREQMMGRFLRSIARTLYFGQRGVASGSNGNIYQTGGLNYFIDNAGGNVFDATGLTETGFRTFLKTATVKGSDKRILICSGAFLEVITAWKLADRQVLQTGDKGKLGFKINEYINDYCELMIVRDLTLDQTDPSIAFLVDPEYIGMAELVPMSTMKNAQNPDQYGYKEGVFWVAGLDVTNMGAFAKFTNVGS